MNTYKTLLLSFALGLAGLNNAQAATINVSTAAQCALTGCNSSGDDGQAGCSLGEAIAAINIGGDVGSAANGCQNASSDDYGINDTINLPEAATLNFTFADNDFNNGATALPHILRTMTIHGNGSTLSRANDPQIGPMRFFRVGFGSGGPPIESIFLVWDDTTFSNGQASCENDCTTGFCECYSGGAGLIHGNNVIASFRNDIFDGNATEVNTVFFTGAEPQRGGAVAILDGDYSSVQFSESIFRGNKSPFGGAIYSGENNQLTVSDCTFTGNSAEIRAGEGTDSETLPMHPLTFAGLRLGGAVLTDGAAFNVARSSFYGNTAREGGAVAARKGAVTVVNTSFFANHADVSGGSFAIPYNYISYFDNQPQIVQGPFVEFARAALTAIDPQVSVTLHHTTITGNSAGDSEGQIPTAQGGGIANHGPGVFYVRNSIVKGNTVLAGGKGPECHGAFGSLGNNNIDSAADGECNLVPDAGALPDLNVDSGLEPCAPDAVVPGQAHCEPLAESAMIGKASSCPSEDQLGAPRDSSKCTIGAIEGPEPTTPEGAVCGNGTVEDGEECDEGEAHNSNDPDAACRTDCRAQRCGDGIVDTEAGEICDGGALCFSCLGELNPGGACAITEADLMDPTLQTNEDVIRRFGFAAVEKCLQVFGGGDSSCSLNRDATNESWASVAIFLLTAIPLAIRRRYFAARS